MEYTNRINVNYSAYKLNELIDMFQSNNPTHNKVDIQTEILKKTQDHLNTEAVLKEINLAKMENRITSPEKVATITKIPELIVPEIVESLVEEGKVPPERAISLLTEEMIGKIVKRLYDEARGLKRDLEENKVKQKELEEHNHKNSEKISNHSEEINKLRKSNATMMEHQTKITKQYKEMEVELETLKTEKEQTIIKKEEVTNISPEPEPKRTEQRVEKTVLNKNILLYAGLAIVLITITVGTLVYTPIINNITTSLSKAKSVKNTNIEEARFLEDDVEEATPVEFGEHQKVPTALSLEENPVIDAEEGFQSILMGDEKITPIKEPEPKQKKVQKITKTKSVKKITQQDIINLSKKFTIYRNSFIYQGEFYKKNDRVHGFKILYVDKKSGRVYFLNPKTKVTFDTKGK